MSKKSLWILGGMIGIVFFVLIYILLLEPSQEEETKQKEELLSRKEDPTAIYQESQSPIFETPEEALEFYLEWSKYPPYSRPLYNWQEDLIKPYKVNVLPVKIIKKPAENCVMSDEGIPKCETPPEFTEIQCKMDPESSVSVGKSDFKIFLYCYNQRKMLKIHNIQPKVYIVWDRRQIHTLPPIYFGDDGQNGDEKANDLIYTFVVRPTAKDWGDMFLEADFEVIDEEQKKTYKHNQRAGWYSTPHIVAEFQNEGIKDFIDNGHLIFEIPIKVYKSGYYLIEGNLQQKDEPREYIATASWEGKLSKGNQTVKLKFWGKVIRDRNIDGPYVLRELRGRRDNSPITPDMVKESFETGKEISAKHTEPLWEFMKFAKPYETSVYKASDFSNKEWDSEEKQERIEYLKSLIK